MDTAGIFSAAFEVAAAGIVMLVLGWAAIERGAAHRLWAELSERRDASFHWCAAMGAAGGCL